MIINQIKLKNFKSHKNTTINLEQGITVIIGSNGAGKSSILEAISYALFKKFNGKLENLIRNPEHADDIINEMEITITFTHETKKYKITRGRKGNTSHAKLYKINNEEKPILESQTDKIVTNDIQKILNIDPDSFLNAVYIKQGEITDLIDKTASERKELISKLLNIDSLEKAWEQIKDIIKTYENKKLEIQLKEENLKKQKETLQK
ncbi:MAG: SMC family ATPase, partial [Methanobacteriaceae archaeon]|nr:SMC family ATPase [Methanobacteriaceae archaeon]